MRDFGTRTAIFFLEFAIRSKGRETVAFYDWRTMFVLAGTTFLFPAIVLNPSRSPINRPAPLGSRCGTKSVNVPRPGPDQP